MSHPLDEEAIFQVARQIPGAEARSLYMDQVCAGDQALRDRVEAFLEADEEEQTLLKSNVDFFATNAPSEVDLSVGQTIGRFKLLQQIGEGGMGTVFMAEQSRPVSRRVALKVIKPGMDSKAVIARFEAERQALAMMDHPNIARVFDAGTTEAGHPYFVMELVKGLPITEYCDEHKMPIRERLNLLIQVCQAVQHAHQKGIIHRDIKPSNVLVAKYDDNPVPKIIDFGVAKAISQKLTERTMFTQYGQIVGTLEYMSPEQAQFNQLDVDTRSDIYSLGVLLYELLTGETPFDRQRLRSSAFEEVLRILREEEPPRPSARLLTSESRNSSAEKRQIDIARLDGMIRGDLDWIVMRAIEKERARRYDSAIRLSEDVRRYLNDEIVQARSPSVSYRLLKFYRRNRTATVSASACLLLLLLGIAGTTWGWLNAQARQMEADVQRNAAVRLVEQNRELVIQRALLKAFEADIEEVDSIIARYTQVLGSDDDQWSTILSAAAYWHAGRYKDARGLIESIGDRPGRTSIPALAILSASYSYDGDFDRGLEIANRLRAEEPRSEYRDLDQLFLGYGLVFVDAERAARLLQDVLDRNPTWLVCHAMLADAWLHLGNLTEKHEPIESAFEKSRALLTLLGDNPFALDVSLFAHRMLIEQRQLKNEDYTELVPAGKDLVRRLQQYPDYILAHAMPGQFFDAIDEEAAAEKAWMTVLHKGEKMWQWVSAGRLYWGVPANELIEQIRQSTDTDNLWALAAIACLQADVPGGKSEGLKAFRYICDRQSSMLDKYYAIHIPLLVGEKKLAVDTARKWREDSGRSNELDTRSEFGSDHILRIIATDASWLPENENRGSQVMIDHILGLLAVAAGDRENAKRHFAAAAAKPRINLDCYWSEAFFRRLSSSEAWPSQNSLMQEGP